MTLWSCALRFLLTFLILPFFATLTQGERVTEVFARLKNTSGSTVNGTVRFLQPNPNSPVFITGYVQGLSAYATRGLHVLAATDVSNDCPGGHFNPYKRSHGAPLAVERHVGDLGNIQAVANGTAYLNFTDNIISLDGPSSILGLVLAVDFVSITYVSQEEILNLQNTDMFVGNTSNKTVNPNPPRAACAIIG